MFTLPKLDYPYDALEPYIDKETVTIHHTKHHQAYTDNLNDALKNYPSFKSESIEALLRDTQKLPEDIKTKVINNGGGYYNHNLYWQYLSPKPSSPSKELLTTLENVFGSFEVFKEKFSSAALTHFGSGWGWLVLNSKKMEIISTPNQNTPLSEGKYPLLGIDVWEHAYYLKYQNRRADYIQAIWNIVNWDFISSVFQKQL